MVLESGIAGVTSYRERAREAESPNLTNALLERIASRQAKVGVVGLGYVGLPLGMAFSEAGFSVLGLDVDPRKVEGVLKGKSYIRHISSEPLKRLAESGKLSATTEFARTEALDCIVVCVPTPLTEAREPDMRFIQRAGRALAPHVRKGQLYVLESTTYPGTTDEVLRPLLERSGLRAGVDFHLAFSPEREDPGNPRYNTRNIPKIVGGHTERCREVAMALYGAALQKIVPVSSTRVAELSKLLENIFRCVNIALVNELKMLCDRMNLDVWEVIEAASTKPFGFMPFHPGPGLGGHCIPIDPFYLSWKARQFEFQTKFIELAGEVNTQMPHYVVQRTMEALNRYRKTLNGSRLLILGAAYKKDVEDVRESPSLRVISLLHERGAVVDYHDPYVPALTELNGVGELRSVTLTAEALSQYDAVLILTDHSNVDYEWVVAQAELKLQGHEPPYFIGYQVKQGEQYEIAARYGALFQNDFNRDRKLYVEVRVGSYEFDNSIGEDMDFNFSLKGNSYITYKNGPIDDDPMALRTALWLITDERYKNALFNYLKKKGENVYSVDNPKKPPSFSREKPVEFVQSPVDFSFDRQRWTRLARDLSGRFKSARAVFDSEVRISAAKIVRYHVSTEGSRLVTEQTLYGVHIQGATRAEDGQLLEDSRDFYSAIEGRLPSVLQLSESTEKLISELLALREAPAIDPYTGPAILEPAAAGVLFHETIGHRLEGERQDDDAAEGKTFRGQVGRRVLPGFISIYDDPTVSAVRGEGLNGFYRYDEEGVPAQRAILVEDGVLRSYILSRHPVEGFLHSNGHGRSQGNRKPMARMANLIIDSKKQVSDADLKTMLIAEAKRQDKHFHLRLSGVQGRSADGVPGGRA